MSTIRKLAKVLKVKPEDLTEPPRGRVVNIKWREPYDVYVDELKDEAKNNDDNKECEAGIHCQLAWEPTSLWGAVPICAHDGCRVPACSGLGQPQRRLRR